MKVRHPNLNEPNVIDVDESAVESHLAAGWVLVDRPARAASKPTNPKPVAGEKE